jgi:uncharacterized membrane protein
MANHMELEHWKCVGFLVSAGVAKYGSHLASVPMAEDVGEWVESGGTVLSVGILLMGLRYMRDKLEKREAKLDELMSKDRDIHEKATEARIKLDSTLEKLHQSNEKLIETIERKLK